MCNKVVSTLNFDSVSLWFWEIVEKFGFELGLDVTTTISLDRKEKLGLMRDALWRGDAEGNICFAVNLLRRARRG